MSNSTTSWSKLHNEFIRRKFHNVVYAYLHMGNQFQYVIPQIIGKEGKHFKDIAHQTGAYYIWYNNTNDRLEIWGPTHESVNFCMLLLLKHIHKFR